MNSPLLIEAMFLAGYDYELTLLMMAMFLVGYDYELTSFNDGHVSGGI